ncbi:MAG: hypothetical protein II797_01755 [Clostridia bacterium]|nr:hypothetical protein [Clostridia bacterium]
MKKTMRILVLLLAAALLLPMLLACVEQNNPPESTAPATTEPDETVIQKQTVYNYTTLTESPEEGIISDFRDILTGSGMTVNWMSNHGGGQTRMVNAPSGIYFGLFTGDDPNADPIPMDLIHLKDDGTSESVLHDEMPYRGSGPMISLMLDAKGNIWMYSGWTDEEKAQHTFVFDYNLWKYEPETGKVTRFQNRIPYYFAYCNSYGGGGYSTTAIDLENNRIFIICNIGNKPGFMEWLCFDLETETWSSPFGAQLDYRYCYTYILPDGQGGYHVFNQRDVQVTAVKTDYGKNVESTSRQTFTNWYDNNMLFDEWDYFHVPDPYAEGVDAQFPVEAAHYEYQKGLYPDFWANSSDILIDKDGYLHFFYTAHENNTYGDRCVHVVYDPKDNMKEIRRQTMDFAANSNTNYFCRMFQDTTGAFYIVCARSYTNPLDIEIWGAASSTDELKLLYAEFYPDSPIEVAGTAFAGDRNGCEMTDTMQLGYYSYELKWYYLTIDFAALREYLAMK